MLPSKLRELSERVHGAVVEVAWATGTKELGRRRKNALRLARELVSALEKEGGK